MKKRTLFLALTAMLAVAGTAGCGKNEPTPKTEEATQAAESQETTKSGENKKEASKKIVIGGTSISKVYYDAIKDIFEANGYETEFKTFDSNPVVLEACASGETDMALGQHKKFVMSYNENNNADLDMAKPYAMYTGIGLYSEKYSSTAEFPDGAKIAVMNDAMNEDIALRILENQGLIKLNADQKQATVADIGENPKKLEIIELDQGQTVTTLSDVDGACVFFTHMAAANKDASSYIARDSSMINYPMGVIVRKEDVDSDWAVAFAECFKDPSVQEKINKAFPNVFEFYKSDDQVKE